MAEGDSLHVEQIPNVDTGTMDFKFQIDEGEKSYVEQIEIRGNLKTKDKVIRRELAISPGEVFDMVKVDISKQRLENFAILRQGGRAFPNRPTRRLPDEKISSSTSRNKTPAT